MLARQFKNKCDFFKILFVNFHILVHVYCDYTLGMSFLFKKNTEEVGKMSERGVKR